MKITDSNTLEDAKLVTLVTTHMVSNPTMRIYLKAVGMFLVVYEISEGKWDIPVLDGQDNETGKFTSHPAKELCLLIVKSLEGSTTDNNDFNFIVGHPKGDGIIADTELFRDTFLPSHSVQIQALLDLVIAHCNRVTRPYENATQEEFDAAKASLLFDVTTEAHTVKYGETQLDYVIKLANQDLQIFAVFDEAPPEDCVVDVFVWEQPIEAVPHAITGKTNVLRANSGIISTGTTLTKNLKRKIKFSATCNKNFPFTLYVNW